MPDPDAADLAGPVPIDLEAAARLAEERGYEAGLERARIELSHAISTAGALAGQLERRAPRAATALAHSIVELGLALARRVVAAELASDPSILVGAVEQAVGALHGSGDVLVLVHPTAVDAVRDAWVERHGTAYLGRTWRFEADPSLEPGGCLVRLDHGFVDAGLETQLEELGIALDAAIPALVAADTDPGSVVAGVGDVPDAGDSRAEPVAVDA